ncbi:MAG TPA: ABC transporter [Paenibacillaceae bacterium]|nr:ABC transporter [Paenibacillaceae bacterium]
MLKVAIKKRLKQFTLDVTFKMDDEIVVLFGPSGSGKTTILNALAGLVRPDEGEIVRDQEVLFQNKKVFLPTKKRNVGYLFQDYALFPHMTVEKNITYGVPKRTMPEFLQQWIQITGIQHLMKKYPNQISGGEKQRAALVRALAPQPRLLLLDEPFSALDSTNRLRCQDELQFIHRKWRVPIILVTHDEGEAIKLADRILYIEKGKIIKNKVKPKMKSQGL